MKDKEKIAFWNQLILSNMQSIYDTYYRETQDNGFTNGWLQAMSHLRILIEDWEEIILDELDCQDNNQLT